MLLCQLLHVINRNQRYPLSDGIGLPFDYLDDE
jgi:hypothetical protein